MNAIEEIEVYPLDKKRNYVTIELQQQDDGTCWYGYSDWYPVGGAGCGVSDHWSCASRELALTTVLTLLRKRYEQMLEDRSSYSSLVAPHARLVLEAIVRFENPQPEQLFLIPPHIPDISLDMALTDDDLEGVV